MEPPLPCSRAISSLTSGGGMPRTEGRPSARRAPARPHKHRARRKQKQPCIAPAPRAATQTRTKALRTQATFFTATTPAHTHESHPPRLRPYACSGTMSHAGPGSAYHASTSAHTSAATTAVDKRVAAHQNTTKAAWLPALLHSAPRRGGGGGRLYELAPPRGPHPPPTCATARRRRGPFAHDLEAGGRLADRGVRVPPGTTL